MCNKEYESQKFALSFPCVYPVCPISFDHTRIYVVGDIYARYYRSRGKEILYPMGFHYSGVTAQKFCQDLNLEGENNTKRIFRDIYKCSPTLIRFFKESPLNILDYFSLKIVQDFKKINLSFDYQEYYTTHNEYYDRFVKAFFRAYEKHGVIKDHEDNIQLDYNSYDWKKSMLSWSENVSTILPREKIILMNSFDDLQNGWNILKNDGFGTHWNDNRIIDSMHDSELLSLYDIVNHVSKTEGEFSDAELEILFELIAGKKVVNVQKKIMHVVSWLPTSVVVMEEHLKVWFIKKLYAESLMFAPRYRTKTFFVLGMGMRDGKRMSSSRGNAILLQDLISQYSPIKVRMILLMVGGHPNKSYNFKESVIDQADIILHSFRYFVDAFLTRLFSKSEKVINEFLNIKTYEDVMDKIRDDKEIKSVFVEWENFLLKGYFGQLLTELMTLLPKKHKNFSEERQITLLCIINYFLQILLGVSIIEL